MLNSRTTMWGCWLNAILIVLMATGYALAESQPPTPTPRESSHDKKTQTTQSPQAATKDQSGTEKSPLVIKVLPPVKSEEETAQERKDREDRTTNERLLIGANILLAIFTAILAVFTAKLWWDSRKTAERQLRAYVGIEKTGVRPEAGTLKALVTVKNSGQTPAYNIRTWNQLCIFESAVNPMVFARGDQITIFSMIGAGATLDLRAELTNLDGSILREIREGTKPTYMWGELIYRDVFDIDRHTTFRLSIGPTASGEWYLRPTAEGNEAD